MFFGQPAASTTVAPVASGWREPNSVTSQPSSTASTSSAHTSTNSTVPSSVDAEPRRGNLISQDRAGPATSFDRPSGDCACGRAETTYKNAPISCPRHWSGRPVGQTLAGGTDPTSADQAVVIRPPAYRPDRCQPGFWDGLHARWSECPTEGSAQPRPWRRGPRQDRSGSGPAGPASTPS